MNFCVAPQWLISEFQLAEGSETLQLPGARWRICIRVISSSSPNPCTHAHTCIHAQAYRVIHQPQQGVF